MCIRDRLTIGRILDRFPKRQLNEVQYYMLRVLLIDQMQSFSLDFWFSIISENTSSITYVQLKKFGVDDDDICKLFDACNTTDKITKRDISSSDAGMTLFQFVLLDLPVAVPVPE